MTLLYMDRSYGLAGNPGVVDQEPSMGAYNNILGTQDIRSQEHVISDWGHMHWPVEGQIM